MRAATKAALAVVIDNSRKSASHEAVVGATGTGVASARIDDGHLFIGLTDGTEINAGPVDGKTGDPGRDGVGVTGARVVDGNLELSLSSGETLSAGRVSGNDGEDGRSIESVEIVDGDLIITMTDGKTQNAGRAKGDPGDPGNPGADGSDGVGIDTAKIDKRGHLIITLTDEQSIDAGLAKPRAKKGDKGDKGDIGPMPRHEWDGTALRFEKAPGEWGEYVDLRGPRGLTRRSKAQSSGIEYQRREVSLSGQIHEISVNQLECVLSVRDADGYEVSTAHRRLNGKIIFESKRGLDGLTAIIG